MNRILILAEHSKGCLSSVTASVVTAAKEISYNIDILIAGYCIEEVVQKAAKLNGISKIRIVDSNKLKYPIAEELSALIFSIYNKYTHIFAASTTIGKSVIPRVAAMIDVSTISDIIGIESSDIFIRTIYTGSAIATIKSLDNSKLITIRSSAFHPTDKKNNAFIYNLNALPAINLTKFVSFKRKINFDCHELTSARVIIAGGLGLATQANFNLLNSIAKKLNAAVGATRAAVDAELAPNDIQIGQTGKIVAPDLYIAIGISGAIQHLAGIQASKVIVAINQDHNAPIFRFADYVLIGDLFKLLPELINKI